jgi:ketosteroid isomerase-like protein
MPAPLSMDELAQRVRAALEGADLVSIGDLLDPDVRWGPPDDDVSGCHNRRQVLSWYEQGRNAGTRAEVTEVIVGDGKLLVGLRVTTPAISGQESEQHDRWQVLTAKAGRIADIRGYDSREEAAQRAGVSG